MELKPYNEKKVNLGGTITSILIICGTFGWWFTGNPSFIDLAAIPVGLIAIILSHDLTMQGKAKYSNLNYKFYRWAYVVIGIIFIVGGIYFLSQAQNKAGVSAIPVVATSTPVMATSTSATFGYETTQRSPNPAISTNDLASTTNSSISSAATSSRLPKGIDGSVLIIEGIRKSANPNFGTYSADQLFKEYSIPASSSEIGGVIFFDYNNDGIMDYVATNLGNGLMTYAASSSSLVEAKPIDYLDSEVLGQGGKIYYMQLNWGKIVASK